MKNYYGQGLSYIETNVEKTSHSSWTVLDILFIHSAKLNIFFNTNSYSIKNFTLWLKTQEISTLNHIQARPLLLKSDQQILK